MKKILFLIILISCNSEKNWDTQIFESLQKLEADKVLVDIEIDGKKFFDFHEDFQGKIIMNKMSCQLDFLNQNSGKINLRLEEQDWSNAITKQIKLNADSTIPNENLNGSFLIGRNFKGIPEGYFLKTGTAEIKQLNQEACIIVIKGILSNPENESITKPINGLIVWKKPKKLGLNPDLKEYFFQ